MSVRIVRAVCVLANDKQGDIRSVDKVKMTTTERWLRLTRGYVRRDGEIVRCWQTRRIARE